MASHLTVLLAESGLTYRDVFCSARSVTSELTFTSPFFPVLSSDHSTHSFIQLNELGKLIAVYIANTLIANTHFLFHIVIWSQKLSTVSEIERGVYCCLSAIKYHSSSVYPYTNLAESMFFQYVKKILIYVNFVWDSYHSTTGYIFYKHILKMVSFIWSN